MNFIIFGPPGSGKGTYASRLAPKLGIVHIASGDLLREFVKTDSPLATEIKGYMQSGALVPDHLVIDFLKKELEKPEAQKGLPAGRQGFILDGFPRTLDQAKVLDEVTHIDAVLHLNIPEEILVEKMTSRRQCQECATIYNIADINRTINGVEYILPAMLPKIPGKCDKCGGKLYQRSDDNEGTIKDRFKTYEEQSKPVLDYYQGKVPFVEVYVSRGPEIMVDKIMGDIKKAGLDK